MDASTFNASINDATELAIAQAIGALDSLINDLENSRIALINARANRSFVPLHLNAYGNRYLQVPKALSKAAALIEVRTTARLIENNDPELSARMLELAINIAYGGRDWKSGEDAQDAQELAEAVFTQQNHRPLAEG